MIIELNLKSKFSDNVTVRSTIIRGKVFQLLERLKQNNSFEISEEVFNLLNREYFYELRGTKVVKVINNNSREFIRKLKTFNDIRKKEHEKMKEFENTLLYSSSSNMKLNDYNNRWARETIIGQMLYGM